jgi:hypothetical protein
MKIRAGILVLSVMVLTGCSLIISEPEPQEETPSRTPSSTTTTLEPKIAYTESDIVLLGDYYTVVGYTRWGDQATVTQVGTNS